MGRWIALAVRFGLYDLTRQALASIASHEVFSEEIACDLDGGTEVE
jgi:hypothetical protein